VSTKTFGIIKPDAVENNYIGAIISKIEQSGLQITGLRMEKLSAEKAGEFYAVHREKPFYKDLCAYMSSGPIVVMRLEGDNAIVRWRELMGATDPLKAEPGTLRRMFGKSIESNATHGSDAPETAAEELAFFFG